MTSREITDGFRKLNGNQMFLTKRDIADAFGVKQTRTINWVVKDLPVINGKYYFLTDVKNAIQRRTKCEK